MERTNLSNNFKVIINYPANKRTLIMFTEYHIANIKINQEPALDNVGQLVSNTMSHFLFFS